jgi:hypothetical protein
LADSFVRIDGKLFRLSAEYLKSVENLTDGSVAGCDESGSEVGFDAGFGSR